MIYRMKLADSVDEMTFDLLEVPIEDKDIEGATDNTTIDGNIFTDYLWLKKQFVQKWSLMCKDDYTQLRGFYTRQWENAEAPTYTLFAGQNRSETLTASGSAFRIQNGTQYGLLTLTELKGNATQNGTPTPDAPKAVQTTTGENEVKITGKNLINENGERSSQYIDNTGNFVNGVANGYVNQQLPTKPNTAYTFSASSKTTQQVYIRIGEYRADGSFIKRNLITSLEQTITTDAECYIIKTYIDVSTGNHFTNPQLELGSTATTYEPYQGQNYEVNLGKNLFIAPIQQGSIGGTNGEHVEPPAVNRVRTSYKIPVKPNTTYTLSAGSSVQAFVFLYQQNGTFIERIPSDWVNLPYTFTTGSTAYQAEAIFRKNASNPDITPSEVQQVQLELGSTATAYEAPIELCKIGSYQDRIYKNDGKWYVEKQIEKRPLNYFTTWRNAGEGDTTNGTSRWTNIARANGRNIPILCSHLEQLPYNNTDHTLTNFIMTGSDNTIAINIANSSISTTFQDWLDTSGATLYFPKNTPTTTEITNQTLINQLNFIANLYGGTNNIMLVGTGAQGEIGVGYTLTYEKEQTIIPETAVRLTLTDGGVINTCECRQNVQLTMRETVQ